MNNYVLKFFECGLFECLHHPWLAASPDDIAVLRTSGGNYLATVEVKTRVSWNESQSRSTWQRNMSLKGYFVRLEMSYGMKYSAKTTSLRSWYNYAF
jgi:hypothetical protein